MDNNYAIYQQAIKNLKKKPNSSVDKYIVDMWKVSAKFFKENMELKAELKGTQQRAADHFRKIDILETKLARATGQEPLFVMPIPAEQAE